MYLYGYHDVGGNSALSMVNYKFSEGRFHLFCKTHMELDQQKDIPAKNP